MKTIFLHKQIKKTLCELLLFFFKKRFQNRKLKFAVLDPCNISSNLLKLTWLKVNFNEKRHTCSRSELK